MIPDRCSRRGSWQLRMLARGKAQGFPLGVVMSQLVCRVCCLLEMLLIRWDTCHDLDESQNLTTTIRVIGFTFFQFYLRVFIARLKGDILGSSDGFPVLGCIVVLAASIIDTSFIRRVKCQALGYLIGRLARALSPPTGLWLSCGPLFLFVLHAP